MSIKPVPRIMCFAKKSSCSWFIAVFYFTCTFTSNSFPCETISNIHDFFSFSFAKIKFFSRYVVGHVLRLRKHFKITKPVICFYAVFVVDYFVREFKLSTEVLFHKVLVLQNSSTVYIYSYVTFSCDARLSPNRKFKTFKSLPPTLMHHATQNRDGTYRWFIASFDPARTIDFSSLHRYSLLANRVG
jgi:hypothetical protein